CRNCTMCRRRNRCPRSTIPIRSPATANPRCLRRKMAGKRRPWNCRASPACRSGSTPAA
ncbi:MAG: hypothetical protein AVDCRST_MAG51-2649, partial [uncultured Ramlibacter sp.]